MIVRKSELVIEGALRGLEGEKAYCVPSAFMAITGIRTSKINQAILEYRRKQRKIKYRPIELRQVKGVSEPEIENAAKILKLAVKFDTSKLPRNAGITLRDWIVKADAGRYLLIIKTRGSSSSRHAIAVEKLKNGDAWVADTMNPKPVKWSQGAWGLRDFSPRSHVRQVWNFRKWHKPKTGDTPDRTPDNQSKALRKAAADKRGKLDIVLENDGFSGSTERYKIDVVVNRKTLGKMEAKYMFVNRGFEIYKAYPTTPKHLQGDFLDYLKSKGRSWYYDPDDRGIYLKRLKRNFGFTERKDKDFFVQWLLKHKL